MMEKRKNNRDEIYALIFRMWVAGALYLLIAQGTPIVEMEGYSYFFPLIFFLGVGLMASQRILVNPVIKAMFKTRLNRDTKTYLEKSVISKVAYNIWLLVLNIIIVFLIATIYYLINMTLDQVFGIRNENGISIIYPESIGFGILYGLFYKVYELIGDVFYKKINRREENGENQTRKH